MLLLEAHHEDTKHTNRHKEVLSRIPSLTSSCLFVPFEASWWMFQTVAQRFKKGGARLIASGCRFLCPGAGAVLQ